MPGAVFCQSRDPCFQGCSDPATFGAAATRIVFRLQLLGSEQRHQVSRDELMSGLSLTRHHEPNPVAGYAERANPLAASTGITQRGVSMDSLPPYPNGSDFDRASESEAEGAAAGIDYAPVCFVASIAIFLITASAWTCCRFAFAEAGGGEAGLAAAGLATRVFDLVLFGIILSCGLALVAAREIRAAWVLVWAEVVLAILLLVGPRFGAAELGIKPQIGGSCLRQLPWSPPCEISPSSARC